MKIVLGSDHAGFPLKEEVMAFLTEQGMTVEDVGCHDLSSVDYPDFGEKVGRYIQDHPDSMGIVICGTGIGISISANKLKGVRAALCHDQYTAEMARKHNNANVLALGARVVGAGVALKTVECFIQTDFEGGRHQRRVEKMMALEAKN